MICMKRYGMLDEGRLQVEKKVLFKNIGGCTKVLAFFVKMRDMLPWREVWWATSLLCAPL